MLYLLLFVATICLTRTYALYSDLDEEEIRAASYIDYLNTRAAARHKRTYDARWQYESNITDYNFKNMIAITTETANEGKQDWLKTIKFRWRSYQNADLRRQFKIHANLGTAALPSKKFEKLTQTVSEMVKVYSTTKLCDYQNPTKCDLSLETGISNILASSRNPDELKHLWVEWRNAIGPKVKDMYEVYANLSNEAAKLNNFTDYTEYWLADFESDDIRDQLQNLWEQVRPLYLQIHAYVRYKLREKYGDLVSERGPIPAHLLRSMWAHMWNGIIDFTLPYPGSSSPAATEGMKQQGYTPLKMFQTANDFFVSLNLTAMPESFWKKSIIEKPSDGREMVCHGTAWDFYDSDVRVKICARVSVGGLYAAHHEMGHAEYQLQYAHQPTSYREAANSGFHEAVGDVIALSFFTPKHLQKIGLLNDTAPDNKAALNNLYKVSLEKIVSLPFNYLIDLWRWDVFSGKIKKDNWNCKYWEFIHKYQGVEPPVDRSENDFDPGAIYHVVADVSYIRYFVSFIIQFQFYKSLCLKAGEYIPNDPQKPLYNCDIYKSAEAGNTLRQMLQMGRSKPWPDAMEVLTGQRNMDASGLLEYFKPLQTWLEEENSKNGVFIGWEPTKKVCSSSKEEGSRGDSDHRQSK